MKYLPLFEKDIEKVRDYIANTLQNPVAAQQLINETENAIIKRLSNPASFAKYVSVKDRKQPYYTIRVKNYIVFYVVIGDVMEVRRFIYSGRDLSKLI